MNRMIFLSGGAGYIGQVTATQLLDAGYDVTLLDDFSTSEPLKSQTLPWVKVDLNDRDAVQQTWKKLPKPAGVIHFAARALVPESCQDPALYFRNNLNTANNLAELVTSSPNCMMVHSSSCAVYGIPTKLPITEDAIQRPESPYGESKRMVEIMFRQYRRWKGLASLNLRYFNPAGAVKWKGQWYGEAHEPETHLIPNIIRCALIGEPVPIYGTDYKTRDGSCVRDFLHVQDLARAHTLALDYLQKVRDPEERQESINLGSGRGYTVLEVIQTAIQTTSLKIRAEKKPRREGDPAELVASIALAAKTLDWRPELDLKEMIGSHFEFRKTSNKY